MKILNLNSEGLFSQDLLYSVPHKKIRLDEVLASFTKWTGDSKSPVFSGYRRQVLESEGLEDSLQCAEALRSRFDSMLVLGIGGSALGARAAYRALIPSVPVPKRKALWITDNLDPLDFLETISQIDLSKCAVALITKSGGTIETMAQASYLIEAMKKLGLPWKEHFVAITDPKGGALRSWARDEGLKTLSVPPDVGGRFSLFTPVGLLPLAFAGLDVQSLVEGAQDLFRGKILEKHRILECGLRLAELEQEGLVGHVLMPYASVLKESAAWFVQLWGESLGKKAFDGGRCGPLPMAAVGATDQHSLLQLLVEGPLRCVTGFVRVKSWEGSVHSKLPTMPPLPKHFESLAFAYGKRFDEILNAEAGATEKVLMESGRPVYRLEMEKLNALSLGAFFAFYMDLTTAAAAARGLNPYDQPGVELGKKLLPGFLKN